MKLDKVGKAVSQNDNCHKSFFPTHCKTIGYSEHFQLISSFLTSSLKSHRFLVLPDQTILPTSL